MENKGAGTLGAAGGAAAIVLAAGFSKRMKAFKPLLPIGQQTAIEAVLGALKEASIDPARIFVVTGHNREALLPILESEQVNEVYNQDYAQGMFSSVQAGIRAVWPGAAEVSAGTGKTAEAMRGVFLLPADYPAMTAEVFRQMMAATAGNQAESQPGKSPSKLAVACFRGKKGHPLWIPKGFAPEILAYNGPEGLKGALRRHEEEMQRVETDHEGVVLDMDTQPEYRELLEYVARGCRTEALRDLAKGRRFFLIRHGQIEQHGEKIFLGQSDVPLSDLGRKQAGEAGETLKGYEPRTGRIYSSDLSRAAETARIVGEKAGIADIVLTPALREMSLGAWDRAYIREIQEKYPDEYEKRGKNLLTYKFDKDSENFYDLRYRAAKGLKAILKEDACEDVVIVSHSGAIKMLLAELSGEEIGVETLGISVGLGSVNVALV